jgi:hypothetical protein
MIFSLTACFRTSRNTRSEAESVLISSRETGTQSVREPDRASGASEKADASGGESLEGSGQSDGELTAEDVRSTLEEMQQTIGDLDNISEDELIIP